MEEFLEGWLCSLGEFLEVIEKKHFFGPQAAEVWFCKEMHVNSWGRESTGDYKNPNTFF